MVNFPLVSVIIPTYNRAIQINDAIESLLKQIYPNIQIIVVDDGSTDNTADTIKQYPTVEYYVKKHAGQATARNFGLKYAKGDYIATLDTDDIWLPNFLKSCVEQLLKENLDLVFANWMQQDKSGNWYNFLANYSYIKPFLGNVNSDWISLSYNQARQLYLKSCPSPSSSVVIRKPAMISNWNEEMRIADDWCLYLDLILRNTDFKIAFTLTPLWKKSIGLTNLVDGRNRLEVLKLVYIEDVEQLILRFENLLSEKEICLLKKMKMASLIELAKNHFLNGSIKQGFKNLKESFATNPIYTLWATPNIFFGGLGRFLR